MRNHICHPRRRKDAPNRIMAQLCAACGAARDREYLIRQRDPSDGLVFAGGLKQFPGSLRIGVRG